MKTSCCPVYLNPIINVMSNRPTNPTDWLIVSQYLLYRADGFPAQTQDDALECLVRVYLKWN